MNITLVYPLLSRERALSDPNKQYWPPLGLAYIAAVLRDNGHSVQVIDRDLLLRQNNLDFDKIDRETEEIITKFNSHIVGFSATTPNVSDVNALSKHLKKLYPQIKTVIGGPHSTGEPELTLEMCRGIDIVVRGEGEMTMLDIANNVDIEKIDGITYRQYDGKIVSNPDRQLVESVDSLPLPARDILEMHYYTRPSRYTSRNLALRTTHIFTSRGCPYNCHYCAGPLLGRRKVRYHSPQRVITEIEELTNKYAVEAIYFAEDMFLSSKKRATEILTLFKEHDLHKKIVWIAQISTKVAEPELINMMKDAGCVQVEYGFESGSQRVLDLMGKMTNVEQNLQVAQMTRECGLRFQGNFIVGYPGETEEDFKKTVSFIKKARPNTVSLNLFMPLPGTEIYKRLKAEGKLHLNIDDVGNIEMPQVNYADMPSDTFQALYLKTRLTVILPMNIVNFLKDNMNNPFRLIYVSFTQFKSVIGRAFREVMKLWRLR